MAISDDQTLAAGEFNGWPRLWVGAPSSPPPPVPEVSDFSASSYTVTPGEMVELTWNTFGADQVTLDGAMVDPDGMQALMPVATAAHTLVARSSVTGVEDSRSLTITVNATPLPVAIIRFAPQPDHLERGRSATLSWEVANATTLEVDGKRVPPTGTREVTPLETTSYLLVAQGLNGPAQAMVTVTVEAQKTGLLPDRGGFRCDFGSRGAAPLWVVLLLLGLCIRRLTERYL
jgi:hypothetical protein